MLDVPVGRRQSQLQSLRVLQGEVGTHRTKAELQQEVAALTDRLLTPCAQRESDTGRGSTRHAQGPPGHLLTIARPKRARGRRARSPLRVVPGPIDARERADRHSRVARIQAAMRLTRCSGLAASSAYPSSPSGPRTQPTPVSVQRRGGSAARRRPVTGRGRAGGERTRRAGQYATGCSGGPRVGRPSGAPWHACALTSAPSEPQPYTPAARGLACRLPAET
jgi:hypothetical protein